MFPINNVVFILKIQSKTCFLHFYLFIGTLELHNIIAFCYVIFQGVSIGLLTGMAVTLWISFGGPRPVPVKLPLSADGCGFNVTQIPSVLIDPSYYPYPYRISYLWTSPVSQFYASDARFLIPINSQFDKKLVMSLANVCQSLLCLVNVFELGIRYQD